MTVNEFLQAVQEIAGERPIYREGGDGSGGECDCIGLVIGAIRRCGGEWSGVHGSNWAARNAVQDMIWLGGGNELCPGQLVFKAREPVDSRWALPSRYEGDPDQRDYYHVGVVLEAEPLRIVHCTTPGIVFDDSAADWDCAATLSELAEPARQCIVTAKTGSTVNMRSSPGGKLVARIPLGRVVSVESQSGDWSRLRVDGDVGWMLTKYLEPVGSAATLHDMEWIVTELCRILRTLGVIE